MDDIVEYYSEEENKHNIENNICSFMLVKV